MCLYSTKRSAEFFFLNTNVKKITKRRGHGNSNEKNKQVYVIGGSHTGVFIYLFEPVHLEPSDGRRIRGIWY